MEGFTYVDIFATKGVEYLLVIGALSPVHSFLEDGEQLRTRDARGSGRHRPGNQRMVSSSGGENLLPPGT